MFPYGTPFLPAFLTTVSSVQTRMDLQGGGGGVGRKKDTCGTGINTDLHTGACGLIYHNIYNMIYIRTTHIVLNLTQSLFENAAQTL